jgi:DNA-binding CsgD family transcriptional regulator
VTPVALRWLTEGKPLTDIQRGALESLAAGLTASELAAAEQISEEAAKDRRRHVLAKLGARNGAHAVAVAYQTGLLLAEKSP